MVLPDHLQFASQNPPEEPSWNYTVSNSAGGLRIDGAFAGPTSPVSVLIGFYHWNVVAVLVAAVPKPMLSVPRASGRQCAKRSAAWLVSPIKCR